MKYMEVLFVIYIKSRRHYREKLERSFLILLIFALCISTEKERMKRRKEKKERGNHCNNYNIFTAYYYYFFHYYESF